MENTTLNSPLHLTKDLNRLVQTELVTMVQTVMGNIENFIRLKKIN